MKTAPFSKLLLFIGLVATPLAPSAPAWSASEAASGSAKTVRFGVFDPDRVFASAPGVAIEHVFVQWQAFNPAAFRYVESQAASSNRQLLVSVEPWTRATNWVDGAEHLLADVVAGNFDPEINGICGELGKTGRPLLVRWGQEMEDKNGRFPWANGDPAAYIEAYRHFVILCRKLAPNAHFGWSPKGDPGLARYYPGNAYVDFVGVSVFGLEAWDIDHTGRGRSFSEHMKARYSKVERYGKPIIVAEFGVAGSPAYRASWLSDMLGNKDEFPLLHAVVYFNNRETNPWPSPYGLPDWRITPEDVQRAQAAAPQEWSSSPPANNPATTQ